MTKLYETKAVACAILAVITGISVIGLMWYSLFAVWPTVIGLVIMIIFQLVLVMFFLGNIVMARTHVDIATVAE